MQPVHFETCNVIYKADSIQVADLPVQRTEDAAVSRWLPTQKELATLIAGGAVELTVSGCQPAVMLRVV